jgi:hypothetical protein
MIDALLFTITGSVVRVADGSEGIELRGETSGDFRLVEEGTEATTGEGESPRTILPPRIALVELKFSEC